MFIFKKVLSYCVVVVLLIVLLSTITVFAEKPSGLYVCGAPFNGIISTYNGVEVVSAKELAYAFGAQYNIDLDRKNVIIKDSKRMVDIRLTLDGSVASVNGKNTEMPIPVQIKDMRVMVALKFVAEKFGAFLYYNAYRDQTVILIPQNGILSYKVQYGDTLWILSKTFSTSVANLKALNGLNSDIIFPGQNLIIRQDVSSIVNGYKAYTSKNATIFSDTDLNSRANGYLKAWTPVTITGRCGDWYRAVTPIGEGYLYSSILYIPQKIYGNGASSGYFDGSIPVDTSNDGMEYEQYTVKKGDTLWSIANKYGITYLDLAKANNISPNSYLSIGQVLKVPVRIIAYHKPAIEGYGEVLDWFSEAQYVLPIGKEAKVIDIETGKSFMIRRTIGANHADCETLTVKDTELMKEIFGGSWTWKRKPFFLEVDGRKCAVSIAGMPHAGVDGVPFMQYVDNRSDDWGYGPNYDSISGNDMDGHFDLYFLNGLRHKDNKYDSAHQKNVMLAGGLH